MKSSVVSKLTQLITDETTKQLAENYHELLPKLVKIDIDHIEDDLSYAVGAAYFLIAGRVIFIPIIYREGKVDSISYIGDTENETLYGLTKRMYKRIVSATKEEFGKALSQKEEKRVMIDRGIIGRLFATPQTISPKVASVDDYADNIIISMLDNPVFANSFEKLASIPEYKEVLEDIYSPRVFKKLKEVKYMNKIASAKKDPNLDRTFTKMSDIAYLPKNKRAEAAQAIARDGFYKLASDNTTNSAAIAYVPKVGEMLFKTKSSLEVLTEPGIYNALTRDLDLVPVFIARKGDTTINSLFFHGKSVVVQQGSQPPHSKRAYDDVLPHFPGFIGLRAGAVNGDPRSHIISVFGKELKPVDAEYIVLTPTRDDIVFYEIGNVTRVGKELVVNVWKEGNIDTVIVGETHRYIRRGNVTYIHPNHVLFLGKKSSDKIEVSRGRNKPDPMSTLLTTNDLDSAFVKTASFDVSYSAGNYFYGGNRYDKIGLAQELKKEGYDRDSISTIIKTAKDANGIPVDFNKISLTLKAILAELSESNYMLSDLKSALMAIQQTQQAQIAQTQQVAQTDTTDNGQSDASGQQQPSGDQGSSDPYVQQIMQMAASVGADGQAILQAGAAQGMTTAQIAQELSKEIAQVQQEQQAQQGGGQQAQAQDQDQQAQQAQAQQPQQAQAQDQDQQAQAQQGDASQGSPMEQDMATQQAAQTQQGDPNQSALAQQYATSLQDLQDQGYNINMTPKMLKQLQQIADKDVLNASIISYLVDTPDAKAVTGQYIEDIRRGVNGLARTLLLVEIQRMSFVNQIGDKQLDKFLSRGKTLLNRMTDFLIDVSIID